jgi:DNA-binding NtrC family response regulator
VINVRLSPLRERKEDIPALINHFLSRVGGNHSLTAEAMEAMLSYDRPGNIRELENCIQHMAALNSGPLLHAAELPSSLQNHLLQKQSRFLTVAAVSGSSRSFEGSPVSASSPGPEMLPAQGFRAVIPLMELERRAITQALEHTKGDRAVAAHLLGIGRTTLYRKLKEYKLVS